MIRDLDLAGNVFLARQRLRKNRREEIIGPHPLNRRRHFLATHKTQQRERAPREPSPARGEDRGRQYSLLQNFLESFGLEEPEDIAKRKAVQLAERDI